MFLITSSGFTSVDPTPTFGQRLDEGGPKGRKERDTVRLKVGETKEFGNDEN